MVGYRGEKRARVKKIVNVNPSFALALAYSRCIYYFGHQQGEIFQFNRYCVHNVTMDVTDACCAASWSSFGMDFA